VAIYEVNIITADGSEQTFVTEDMDNDLAIKTRLKSFVDAAFSLKNLDEIDIKLRINPDGKSPKAKKVYNRQMGIKCMYDPEQLCPLEAAQSVDSCLHCEGRGL